MNAPADTIEFAEEELGGKLLQILVSQLEHQPEPWNSLTESQQQIALNAMSQAVDAAVTGAVHTIASGRRTRLRAVVESVTFKDGVKAVMTLHKDQGAHDLADAEGGAVLIVLVDADFFTKGTNKVEPAPDQGALPLATKKAEPPAKAPVQEETPPASPEARPIPEVHKLKNGVFEIVIGKDKLHYPGSPESFKSAQRAEDWLTTHLAKQEEGALSDALAAFRTAGEAEAKKADEDRNWDDGFARACKAFPQYFIDEHYTELSAAFADGFDKALGDD